MLLLGTPENQFAISDQKKNAVAHVCDSQLIAAQNRRESRRAPKNAFSHGRTHTSFPGPLKHVNGIAHKPFTQNVVRALRVVQRLTQRLVQLLQFCIQKMHEQP